MWATLIVSIAKAIPAARAIYEDSVALFYANDARQDGNHMTEVQLKRDTLVAAIRQPGLTDVQKRTLRKSLIALSAE